MNAFGRNCTILIEIEVLNGKFYSQSFEIFEHHRWGRTTTSPCCREIRSMIVLLPYIPLLFSPGRCHLTFIITITWFGTFKHSSANVYQGLYRRKSAERASHFERTTQNFAWIFNHEGRCIAPDENAEKEMGKIIWEKLLKGLFCMNNQMKEWKWWSRYGTMRIYEVMILMPYLHHTIKWGLTILFQKAQRGCGWY